MAVASSRHAPRGRSAKPSYWRRLADNLLMIALLCFLGFLYLAVAVVYDLTAGDGIGLGHPGWRFSWWL